VPFNPVDPVAPVDPVGPVDPVDPVAPVAPPVPPPLPKGEYSKTLGELYVAFGSKDIFFYYRCLFIVYSKKFLPTI
jgi:hypothetical protein